MTQEIATNMQTAAVGVQSISENMNQIVTATKAANAATAKVREASLALAS